MVPENSVEYDTLRHDILDHIENARINAAQAVNNSLIHLYFTIGEILHQRQEEYGWRKAIVARLSKDINQKLEGQSQATPATMLAIQSSQIVL